MKKSKAKIKESNRLRKQAEESLNTNFDTGKKIPSQDSQKLIEELQIHQIELELQNEELRRAQQELEAARDKYSDLYNFSPVGFFTLNQDLLIIEANLTCTNLLGVERINLIRRRFFHHVDKDYGKEYDAFIRQSFATEENQACELKLVKNYGTSFYARLESSPVKDPQGNLNQLGISLIDINERKQAEDALRKTHDELEQRVNERTAELMKVNEQLTQEIEERRRVEEKLSETEFQYRTIADFTYDWEYWSNLDGTLRYVSPACKRISGYEPREFIENPWLSHEIIVPEDRDVWEQHVHDSRSELKPREIQFRINRRDGEIRWIEHACQPVVDNQGEILGFRASNRDITKRKQLEMEAQQHREELAHLVRVATLGELSAALAHELNQPLTAILSNAQAAQRFIAGDTPDLDEVRDILTDIVAEDKRAGEIIQRLGLLMKKEKVHFESLNINDIIREAANLVYSDMVILNVSISMNLNEGLPPVRVDKIQLQQVILNFILNASEAMKDRDPKSRQLEIITRKGESDTIVVSVKDSGKGIEIEDFDKVFEPFYTTKSGGLGMGLPINRRIIEAHDGRLWAESNPEGGMTFLFSLPIGDRGKA